jgi:hypothetical protein
LDQWLTTLLERARGGGDHEIGRADGHQPQSPSPQAPEPAHAPSQDHGGGHDR